MTWILGLSGFYHDSAVALLRDGEIVAAAQEERFSRKKFDARFPQAALSYALQEAGIGLRDVDHVVFYDKPLLKFERLIASYAATAPRGFAQFRVALPAWLRDKLFFRRRLLRHLRAFDAAFPAGKLGFCEHHLSHAASAFFPSPFAQAAILTLDGVGEKATSSVAVGQGNTLALQKELQFPHSLGLLYSAFTHYTGFKVNSGEYKLMGLAPYGAPRFAQTILDRLIDLKPDGSFRLNMDYFGYMTGLKMTRPGFDDLFGAPARRADIDPLTPFHMDIAASIQMVTEEVVLRMTRALAQETGLPNLCLAGGVALNCVANGKLARDGAFRNIWIQPAAGDAGGALGAALAKWHLDLKAPRPSGTRDAMQGAYLGPAFSPSEIESALSEAGAVFDVLEPEDLITSTAQALAEGAALGWFQGRMEFGPRALGNRSILADPRRDSTQTQLNLKVKFRESFRPFAPSILSDRVCDWFDQDRPSPYMLEVAALRTDRRAAPDPEGAAAFGLDKLKQRRSDVPAVTHVDYSARLHSVDTETNPTFHALLRAFEALTGCPMLVNTSFNIRGEPIVCTPKDALRCFLGTDLDRLVIGRCVLIKSRQPMHLRHDYRATTEPD